MLKNRKKIVLSFNKLGTFVRISQQNSAVIEAKIVLRASKRAGFLVHVFVVLQMLINFAPTARDPDFPMAKEGLEFGFPSIF